MKVLEPLPSKQFRPFTVLKTLKDHFKKCWELDKATSPKLTFYHSIKKKFEKEPYLDVVKNASNRFRITRLRISAHDLEIERGRYKNIPRAERFCKWCQISLSANLVENESHMLYTCDMYCELRTKLVNTLNNSPNSNDSPSTSHIIVSSPLHLENSLMILLSPHVTTHFEETDPLMHHHLTTICNAKPHSLKVKQRSYIMNTIGSFIAKCFDKRWSFLSDLSSKN